MAVKQYKFSSVDKWNNGDPTKEIVGVGKFIIQQLRKGWNEIEVIEQCENSYGFMITNEAIKAFRRNLT